MRFDPVFAGYRPETFSPTNGEKVFLCLQNGHA